VKIELSSDGGATFPTVISAGTTNDGSESWIVTGAVTSLARVRVTSVSVPTVLDASNANFSIVQPALVLTSPNGGEGWLLGSTQSISWSSSNLSGNIKIELSTDGGATYPALIAASTANDGAEPWVVTGSATTTARIRLTSVSIPALNDVSDANFSLLQPSITVLSPNGGENWIAGTTQSIQWTSSNLSGNVNIDLSTDGGATYPIVVAANTSNDGLESWTVASTGTPSARIRVASATTGTISDASNANFTIVQPSLTVLTPNGGETWEIGTTRTISWTSDALSGTVTIELSRNGGTTYETIATGTANDGTENWVVTGPATSNAKVRLTSVENPLVSDVSNSPLSLTAGFFFLTRLYVQDTGADFDSLDFGSAAGATDGMDPQFGEYELPPLPPSGIFDVRWRSTGLQGMDRDVLDTLGGIRTQCTYSGLVQAGTAGYPITLRWNHLDLPQGTFTIKDNAGGTSFNVNMKLQDSVVMTDPDISVFLIVYSSATGTTLSSPVNAQWNLVSVPLTISDRRRLSLFPTSNSNPFAYQGGAYVNRDTLDYGLGYWLKFPSAQSVSLTGVQRSSDTITVVQGWNIVGSISAPVAVASIGQIPAGIVASDFFTFGVTGYSSATAIEPLRAYWVKVNQSGRLILH
jgi:hypothetical protein